MLEGPIESAEKMLALNYNRLILHLKFCLDRFQSSIQLKLITFDLFQSFFGLKDQKRQSKYRLFNPKS